MEDINTDILNGEGIKFCTPDDCVTSRTAWIDQAAKLGQLTNMNYVFGKTIDLQGGKYRKTN